MRSCAQDPDPPGGVLDDRQHIQTRAGEGDGLEKIAGEQGRGLGAEEASPGSSGALACRVDPGVVQDLPHGRGGDLDPEDGSAAGTVRARRVGSGAAGRPGTPVCGGEPQPGRAQLPFQDRDLVAQRQDLRVVVPVTHRKKPQ